MSEILRKWLSNSLGIVLDLNLLSFGELVKDGTLIAQLLRKYGVLHCDENFITKSEIPEVCFMNLKNLSEPLKSIGIECSDQLLQYIANGEGKSAMKLFYQLYLRLHSKNKLYFTTDFMLKTHDKKEESLKEEETIKTNIINKNDINSTKALFNWHKNKYLELTEKCRTEREKYIEHFRSYFKNQNNMTLNEEEQIELQLKKSLEDSKSLTNKENIDVQSEEENETYIPKKYYNFICQSNPKEAKKYLKSLKIKLRKIDEKKMLQIHMQKMLLSALLTTLMKKQEAKFKNTISNKLLKQSYYEKQMVCKLLEIRNQKDTMVENRKMENEILLKKTNEEFMEQLFQQTHNVSLAKLRNTKERKRMLELHKKLYNERCTKRYKKHYTLCSNIISDIVDLSIRKAEYKESYNHEVPQHVWSDWVSLFCNGQAIFDYIEEIDELLEEGDDNEKLTLEAYRQDGLDEKDLYDYLNLEWPWNISEIENLFLNNLDVINCGANILGYDVHRVLLAKYPFPPPPTAPNLPKVFTACCIIGIKDDSVVNILERILMKKGIIVISSQVPVNYCLDAYLKESALIKESNNATEETHTKKKNPKISKKEIKVTKGKKKKVASIKAHATSNALVPKETQTPAIFPGEDYQFSEEAKLGKYVHDTLNSGLPINHYLFSHIFMQYLKSFKRLKGWVLLDYPENVEGAIALELALTGKQIQDNFEEDNEDRNLNFMEQPNEKYSEYLRENIFDFPEDENAEKRISRLVPNPKLIEPEEKSKSYLTSFLHVIKKNTEPLQDDGSNINEILEKFTPVEDFYNKLNCGNIIEYTTFDADTIKEIVTLVTKDYVFARDIYKEIVELVFEGEEKRKKELKRLEEERLAEILKLQKKLKKKKNKKEKKKKKNEAGIKGVETEIPIQQIVLNTLEKEPSEPEVIIPPKPGELNWNYSNLTQNQQFQIILATMWEDIEEIFINDFKQTFFLLRLHKNSVIPYVHKINTHMTEFIERPDRKQEFVHKFQKTYNELENDLREDDEFKIEMHCRIRDFKTKLWDISLMRKREAEEERLLIINENWFFELAVVVLNTFVNTMQIEIDRCIQTFQFLQDYYTSTVSQEPADYKFNKITLPTYKSEDNEFLTNTYIDITRTITNTPLNHFLDNILKNAINAIKVWHETATNTIKNAETNALKSTAGKIKKKKVAKKPQPAEPSNIAEIKNNITNLISEWQTAVDGELMRIKFRLHLLNAKAHLDVNEILAYGENLFHKVHSDLKRRHHDEINSIETLCNVFHRATEACESIQPRLVLEGAKFYIDNSELLYGDVIELMHPLCENLPKKYFTMTQLLKSIKIFLDLAPNGSLPTKSFIFILQDIITHSTGNAIDNLIPLYWQYLEPTQVQETVIEIFGSTEYISWKDFILYNLELPFPTELQLLDIRQQFREMDPDKMEFVNKVQFFTVQFWFEKDNSISCRLHTDKCIKQLFFLMYQIKRDRINYSALLLDLCKDNDPIIGVAKAFGLCMGKLICWDKVTGNNYIEILRYQKYLTEQENANMDESRSDSVLYKTVNSNVSDIKSSNISYQDEAEQFEDARSYILEDLAVEEEEFIMRSPAPSLCYVLPFHVIVMIMTAALPWHARVQCMQEYSLKEHLESIYNDVKNEEFQVVFSHEFLNCKQFKDILKQNNKFLTRSPVEIVTSKAEHCTCHK